jgi:hypothetical protein
VQLAAGTEVSDADMLKVGLRHGQQDLAVDVVRAEVVDETRDRVRLLQNPSEHMKL